MLLQPWQSGLDFKTAALQYRHMTCHISLCRDRDAGSVSPEPVDGSPVINYTPSKFDRAHIATGLVAIAKLCYVLGAKTLAPAVSDVPSFHCLKPAEERNLVDQELLTGSDCSNRLACLPLEQHSIQRTRWVPPKWVIMQKLVSWMKMVTYGL
jgi:hypothetical protein